MKALLPRLLSLSLCAALLLPAQAAEEEQPAPLTPARMQEDLDCLYETLQKGHPDLFSTTSQADYDAAKAGLESRLEGMDELTFALEVQAFVALAGDSHTTANLGGSLMSRCAFFPFALQLFEGRWCLLTLESGKSEYLGRAVLGMNGHTMEEVEAAFAGLVSADNPVKLRRQMVQMMNTAEILDFVGITRPGEDLNFTLEGGGTLTLPRISYQELAATEFSHLKPETPSATSYVKGKCYLSFPLDENTYYIQYNVCREDEDNPMETFTAQVMTDLSAGSYRQVILDLRNNGGGSDGVLYPLLEALGPQVRSGQLRLWGLIGETTFSSAIINAVEIKEMGGLLAGSPTSGSVDHFGSTGSFALPNSGIRVSCSRKYIDQSTLFEAAIPYGVEPLMPDLLIETTLADYRAGVDTQVEALLARGLDFQPTEDESLPLTRGRLLQLLYQAAGRPRTAGETPFEDLFPIAYYTDAAAWAAGEGILIGTDQGALKGARPVTRAEAALLASRYAQAMECPLSPIRGSYADQGHIPAWAANAAAWDLGLAEAGEPFRPNDGLTLAQGRALVDTLTK